MKSNKNIENNQSNDYGSIKPIKKNNIDIISNFTIDKIDINNKNDEIIEKHSKASILIGLLVTILSITIIFTFSNYFHTIKMNLPIISKDFKLNSVSTNNVVKPNVIIILADDLGWNSVGYTTDNMLYLTPVITKLANNGIIMNNFYSQEVCTPSRASLLTGRYPLSIGMQYGMVLATAEWGMPLDEITLAEVLKEENYNTHMLGKWHLGHYTPDYLPTSRGFDDYIGFLNGENYYWSKRSPDFNEFIDFLESDQTCYTKYAQDDINEYSTTLYTNKALDIIDNHPNDKSLFLYLAYQAVHDPFIDYDDTYVNGIPDSYLPDDVLEQINTSGTGLKRKEYMKSLYLLDQSIGKIYDKLDEKDLLDNTYIVFLSDNGGCHGGGGKNGPLRGSKGSLFEGAVKVNSFISSPLLKSNQGSVYNGLMHISDWFPTILSLVDVNYSPISNNQLDGVSQLPGWNGLATPRSTMLYNIYTSVTDRNFDIWKDGSFAIRNDRYKLMHTYNDVNFGNWYEPTTPIAGDNDLSDTETYRCAQQFIKGEFTYWLFDLNEDPYEYNNLYDSTNSEHVQAKQSLYSLLPNYVANAKVKPSIVWSNTATDFWKDHDSNVVPWDVEYQINNIPNNVRRSMKSTPKYCETM